MRTLSALFCLAVLTGCTQAPPPPDTRAADAEAIHKVEAEWAKESAAKQIDAMMRHYAEDAVVYTPDIAPIRGKEAIRKSFEEDFKVPGYSLSWQVDKVEVARSGDIGYSRGPYEYKTTGPKGETMVQHGYFFVVWRKQGDGTWKVVEDVSTTTEKVAPAAKGK